MDKAVVIDAIAELTRNRLKGWHVVEIKVLVERRRFDSSEGQVMQGHKCYVQECSPSLGRPRIPSMTDKVNRGITNAPAILSPASRPHVTQHSNN